MNQEQTNITTGKQIRHLRTQLGMTQEELAGELNVTRQALSNWERDVNEPDLNMLKKICFLFGVNMDDFAKEVITKEGGTIYQAFLSALSYHRWNSPVSGKIVKAYHINGSYYGEALSQGFENPNGADPVAANDSQAFLTSTATRAVIFIQADNPKIGLMCFVAVGMGDVSNNEITVRIGQHVKKGEQLGMFHFGGSTHVLLFQPTVDLDFNLHGQKPGIDSSNIKVRDEIAVVK